MKKVILMVTMFVLAIVVGISAVGASPDESTTDAKTVEEAYQDALNNISDIPLDELNGISTNVEIENKSFSNDETLSVRKYKTAQILEETDGTITGVVTLFEDLEVVDDNTIVPFINRGREKWDGGYGVQAYNRIYFTTTVIDGMTHAKLDSVTGGWRIADFTYHLSNRKVELVAMGVPSGFQTDTRYPSGNIYNYTTLSSWGYINLNAAYTLGSNSKVTLTKGSSVWDLVLTNYY